MRESTDGCDHELPGHGLPGHELPSHGLPGHEWPGGNGPDLLGGRYRLIEQLGAGGMAVVWRGHDELLGRQVAIKMLASRFAGDRAFRDRIRKEARAAARLCHPHITNVYDYGETVREGEPVPYVVLELIEGESLAACLRGGGRMPWRQAVLVCAEVAAALAAAHARGVVHRDVTPGNVMLTAVGAKIVDFGISALVGTSDVDPDGQLLGTPAYLAPERLDAGQVSPATDVYAVGVLLYRALTGRLPWQAETTTQMLHAHRYADPAPMPPVPGLPDEVVELCRRCLAKNPADRPSSLELARALAAATRGERSSVRPGGARARLAAHRGGRGVTHRGGRGAAHRRGGRRTAAAAAGFGVLMTAGLAWGVAERSGAEPDGRVGLGVRPGEQASCAVEYTLREDSGSSFGAEVTVRNTGSVELRDWWLLFAFPSDQKITGGEAVTWRQEGRQVRLAPEPGPASLLAPDVPTMLRVTGEYSDGNPLPVRFRLGETVCDTQVSAMVGSADDSAGAAGTAAGGPLRVDAQSHDRPGATGGSQQGEPGGPKKPGPKKPGPGKPDHAGAGKGGKPEQAPGKGKGKGPKG